MPFTPNKREIATTLVVSVNLGPDVCTRLEGAVDAHFRKGSFVRCDSYISTARRPIFLGSLKAAEASIVFIDFDESTDHAIESARYLTQAFPGKVSVVAVGRSRDPGIMLNAMRAGCCEFLSLPLQTSSLLELFERLDRNRISSDSEQTRSGSVISFIGVKGGVGATTLATHFAVYLAQCYQKRTLLIDSRPELGHVAIYLGINSEQCLFPQVVRNVERLDSELLSGFLAEHSSGLSVLTSPDRCGDVMPYHAEAIAKSIEFIRGEFDYIVVDCGMAQQEWNAPFVAASQNVYLVLTPEVSAIRDLTRHVEQLDRPLDKVQLVLNRVSRSDVIQAEEIEESTGLKIAMAVPSMGREFVRACNLGEPLMPNPKQPLTEKLSAWVAKVAGATTVVTGEAEHKGFLPFKRTANHALLWKKGFAYDERH